MLVGEDREAGRVIDDMQPSFCQGDRLIAQIFRAEKKTQDSLPSPAIMSHQARLRSSRVNEAPALAAQARLDPVALWEAWPAKWAGLAPGLPSGLDTSISPFSLLTKHLLTVLGAQCRTANRDAQKNVRSCSLLRQCRGSIVRMQDGGSLARFRSSLSRLLRSPRWPRSRTCVL